MITTPTHGPAWRAMALVLFSFFAVLPGCGTDEHSDHDDPAGHEGHAAPAEQEPPGEHDHGPAPEVTHEGGQVLQLRGDLARRLGAALAEARVEDLHREIRATGEIVPDETRLSTVSPRFGGWAEALHVDFTGRHVRAGEPLLEVYSPELLSAQQDLLSALRLADELRGSRVPGSEDRAQGVVAAARDRLRFWQIPETVIGRIEETGEVEGRLTLEAPFTGFVLEKGVQAGERFEAGATLYRLADLSRVWLEAEVYERDLPLVGVGTRVAVHLPGGAGRTLSGEVSYLHPTVDRERRTTRARIELPNPGGELRPGSFGEVRLHAVVARDAITVPRDAVLHTGGLAVVFLYLGDDRWELREVELGAETGERTEIRAGVEAGDRVVARAGFVFDSESRLMEAMMGQPGMPGMEMGTHGPDGHGAHGDPPAPPGNRG